MVNSREMSLRGRIGGYSKAAKYSPGELTKEARAGFLARFMPSDPTLSEGERERRAEAGLRAHMSRLARLSAISRSRRGKNVDRA